jgi:hypothetical protein
VWRGGVWCGVVWCGVVWCGVVWCGVDVDMGVLQVAEMASTNPRFGPEHTDSSSQSQSQSAFIFFSVYPMEYHAPTVSLLPSLEVAFLLLKPPKQPEKERKRKGNERKGKEKKRKGDNIDSSNQSVFFPYSKTYTTPFPKIRPTNIFVVALRCVSFSFSLRFV